MESQINFKRVVFFILILTAYFGNAQNGNAVYGDLITDRPDATESPTVVPKRYLQIETGGLYESFEENNVQLERYVYNTTLLRYGILNNLELRVGWDFTQETTTINGLQLDNSLNGLSPLLLGVKVAIAEEKNGFPEIGLIGHLFLPFTASNDFKTETTGADFRFAFSHTLSEKSSLSYNLGGQWRDDSPEIAYIYTLSYGYAITGKFGAYAELYGDFPEDSKANHFWDAGITYLVKPNLQLDATVGSGITDDQDILLSAGVSYRIPN